MCQPQIGNLIEARRFLAHAETAATALKQQCGGGSGEQQEGGGRAVALAEAQVHESNLSVCWFVVPRIGVSSYTSHDTWGRPVLCMPS